MAKELTLNQLKGLKGKTLFININGKVVACRFARLEVYTTSIKIFDSMRTDKFRYTLECADGTKIMEYYACFPKLYYTIDDCIKGVNSLYMATLDKFAPIESIISGECQGTTTTHGGVVYRCCVNAIFARTWQRNPKTLEIKERDINNVRYDVIQDKIWCGCGPEYEEFVGYKTKEDCQRNSTIEVVTF